MPIKKMFRLGCAGRGVMTSSKATPVSEKELPIDEQFRLQKEAGIWDFVDRLPESEAQYAEYMRASEKYELPVLSGCWSYVLGRDEPLIRRNIDMAQRCGSSYHDLMIVARHAEGHFVTNEEVVDSYLRVYEYAEQRGVMITYESHVDMWSEDFRRVSVVADMVRRHGIPYNHCIDYSHNIFKIENEIEQAVSGLRGDREAIRKLDPFNHDSFVDEWLGQNMVVWAQVRPAAPNGPLNWWGHEFGLREGMGHPRPGRSIQYPFSQPGEGEWHTEEWHAHKLACTKEVARKIIDDYLRNEHSKVQIMTIDNINLAPYGGGWKYDMFADSCRVARYVRELYAERAAIHEARQEAGGADAFVDRYRA